MSRDAPACPPTNIAKKLSFVLVALLVVLLLIFDDGDGDLRFLDVTCVEVYGQLWRVLRRQTHALFSFASVLWFLRIRLPFVNSPSWQERITATLRASIDRELGVPEKFLLRLKACCKLGLKVRQA